MPNNKSGSRWQCLDVLRAVAIGLVMFRHGKTVTSTSLFTAPFRLLQRGGWTGVDLFFVLSGYLISGLLFREFKRTGRISYGRFLIRRAFRIYPPLWFLLACTVAVQFRQGIVALSKGIFVEAFFLTNYFPKYAFWSMTWSLAVEEHFYLLFPLALILMSKPKGDHRESFDRLPDVFTGVSIVCLAFRYAQIAYPNYTVQLSFYSLTHHRVDALFFGVLISYFHFKNPAALEYIAHRFRFPLICLGAILFGGAYVFPIESSWWALNILGLTQFYIAAGMWLVAAIGFSENSNLLVKIIAWVGKHSYSIYLWHVPVIDWILKPLDNRGILGSSWICYTACFWILSIGLGSLFSILIEGPALDLRDKYFPSPSGSDGLGNIYKPLKQAPVTH